MSDINLKEFNKTLDEGNTAIYRNGQFIPLDTTYTEAITFEDLGEAFLFMYALRKTRYAYQPEFSVYNPSPSQPKRDHLLPKDLILQRESNMLLHLPPVEFVATCLDLVEEKKPPVIGVLFGTDKRNIIRVQCQCLIDEQLRAPYEGKYACEIYVSGGTAYQNESTWESVFQAADKWYQAFEL